MPNDTVAVCTDQRRYFKHKGNVHPATMKLDALFFFSSPFSCVKCSMNRNKTKNNADIFLSHLEQILWKPRGESEDDFFFSADSKFSKCFTLCLSLENGGQCYSFLHLWFFLSSLKLSEKKDLEEKTFVCVSFPQEKIFHQNVITVWFHTTIFFFVRWKKKKKVLERLSWHRVIKTGQKMDHEKNKAWREKLYLSVRSVPNLQKPWGTSEDFLFYWWSIFFSLYFFLLCLWSWELVKKKKGQKLMSHHTKETTSLCPSGLP